MNHRLSSIVLSFVLGLILLIGLITLLQPEQTQAQTTFDCSAVSEIPQSECEALVAFYDVTNGSNWDNKDGWLETTTPCSWYGLTCEAGHIDRIDIEQNNLQGTLPPEIEHLSYLTVLILGDNQLTSLPPEFGNLTSLEGTYLSGNLFQTLPPEIGDLPNLEALYVGYSYLTKIPPEIGNITSLVTLDLAYNLLNGPMPDSLITLSLDDFYFYENNWCIPDDPDLISWLDGIGNVGGPRQDCVIQALGGRVMNEAQDPLPTIQVALRRDFYGYPSRIFTSTHTDATGQYHFDNLSAGATYYVYFTDPTNTYTPEYYDDKLSLDAATAVTITQTFTRTDIDAILTTTIPISGLLVTATSPVLVSQTALFTAGVAAGSDVTYVWDFGDGDTAEGQMVNHIYTETGVYTIVLTAVNAISQASAEAVVLVQDRATFFCSDVSEIPQSECEALVAFYDATNGPNWDNNMGWLETNMPCSWYGLTCDAGHISQISLGNLGNGLEGGIPPEFGALTYLKWLDLPHNQITELPPEIGALSALEMLILQNNQLSSLPPEIGNLSNLLELWLFSNQLHSLPAEIGDLPLLERMVLFDNQLSNLPAEIGKLSALTELVLADNQLTEVPPQIGDLNTLEILALEGNRLSSLPSEIGNLSTLERLYLSDNHLGALPPEIGGLNNLYYLGVATNTLHGPVPDYLTTVNLNNFYFNGTGWCIPDDPVIVNWLDTIDDLVGTGRACVPQALEGSVIDETNESLESIQVSLYREFNPGFSQVVSTTHTDDTGEYNFNNLSEGAVYYVYFTDPAETYFSEYYDDEPSLDTATPITVTQTITRPQVNARLDIIPAPIVGLVVTATSPITLNQTASFTASIAAGTEVTYTWSLGDGAVAVGATATHVYSKTGTYTVTVTAVNSISQASAETTVRVESPYAFIFLPLVSALHEE